MYDNGNEDNERDKSNDEPLLMSDIRGQILAIVEEGRCFGRLLLVGLYRFFGLFGKRRRRLLLRASARLSLSLFPIPRNRSLGCSTRRLLDPLTVARDAHEYSCEMGATEPADSSYLALHPDPCRTRGLGS